LRRGSTNIDVGALCLSLAGSSIAPPLHCATPTQALSAQACGELAVAAAKLEGLTRTTGSNVYQCLQTQSFPVVFSRYASPQPPFAALVTWQAPTQNTDGTPLVDLTGYRISYSSAGRSQALQADAPATVSRAVVSIPSAGEWRFEVTAIAGSSRSEPSVPVTRLFP